MQFRNLDGSGINKGLSQVLRWKLGMGGPSEVREALRSESERMTSAPRVENDGRAIAKAERSALTWIGHATYLIQLGGLSIVIDPVLSNRLFAIKRLVATGLAPTAMPALDVCLVTHNHRDHMDAPSLEALDRKLLMVVPKGLGRWFASRGFLSVVELEWWQHTELRAKRFIAMHWGTFKLTDEPIGEPPLFTQDQWHTRQIEAERLLIPNVGETVWL